MYVPGAIKRVLKKADLNKAKSVTKPSGSSNFVTENGQKFIILDDGTKQEYPVEVESFILTKSTNKWVPADTVTDEKDIAEYKTTVMPEPVASSDEANIVTSLVDGKEKTHAAVLDLDFPHVYVPSSTPGHGHLYIDKEMDEETYWLFLEMLVDLELLEPGYYQASKARGYSAVRLPHIKKEVISED